MYNCYAVVFAGSDFCYFKTKIAADNFITMWNKMLTPTSDMKVEGRYIPGVF